MGKELQFPTKAVRDWRLLEDGIAAALREARASEDMTAQVTAHMKEHFQALDNSMTPVEFKLPFPPYTSPTDREAVAAVVEDGLTKITAEIHQQSNIALFQLLATEIRLYVAQHGHP